MKSRKQNDWVEYIKKYSDEHKVSTKEAAKKDEVQKSYHRQKMEGGCNCLRGGARLGKEERAKYEHRLHELRQEEIKLMRLLAAPMGSGRTPEIDGYENAKEGTLKGGAKLPASEIKKFVGQSGKSSGWHVDGYDTDKGLSTKWVQVYRKIDPKGEEPKTVLIHRGSADLFDAYVDMQLAVGHTNNARFKESERIQKAAERKYGTDKMMVIGSSLGGYLAQTFGRNAETVITIGRPTTPKDLILGKKPHDHQIDIRTSHDPISMFKPLEKKRDQDIQAESKNKLDVLGNHLGESVMSHEDIKDRLIGTARKAKVRDLKTLAKILKKGRSKEKTVLITNLKKKELQELVLLMLKEMEDQDRMSDRIWDQLIGWLHDHSKELYVPSKEALESAARQEELRRRIAEGKAKIAALQKK